MKALAVNYGQNHARELDSAVRICDNLALPLYVVDVPVLASFLGGDALTKSDVPVPEEVNSEDTREAVVVPNRNMIFISIAAGHAISIGYDQVAIATYPGAVYPFPDSKEVFDSALNTALLLADWREVSLLRPFVKMTKAEIVRLGKCLKVPFENTWSCYGAGEKQCGKCGACVARKGAFKEAGFPDPTRYVEV